MSQGSAALVAYQAAASCLAPAAPLWLRWRAAHGKEVPSRLGERYGIASRARPPGELVWAHGASIGETMALLPVVEALVAQGQKVLVTSSTVTSADLLSRRLPPGARHQFMPLDAPRFVGRFLDHWRPRLALFAESELWPATLAALARRHIPMLLVNGRLSERSARRWARAPGLARAVAGRVTLGLAQSEGDARRLADMGVAMAGVSGNLKFDMPPPPADPAVVERLAALVPDRTIWMAASTHPGEDDLVVAAHAALRASRPGLLTFVAPRHPERSGALVDAARRCGLGAVRRSDGALPHEAGDLYVIDTIGELGTFYRLSPLVLMGGSLVAHGGQNPYEPARLGTALLHGPHVANFADIYAALDASGGALPVEDGDMLARAVGGLLSDGALMRDMARASAEAVLKLGGALARTMAALAPYLPPPASPGEALW